MSSHSNSTQSAGSAAIMSAGIGCALMGAITTLAAASSTIKSWLDWGDPAGPLAGKTALASAAWVSSWILLHRAWSARDVSIRSVWPLTILLIGLGLIGTFPPFFELLHS